MLKKLSSYTFALLGLTLLFTSCKKEYESIQDTDETKIQQYLTANNLQFDKDPSGFYYKIEHLGTGDLLKNTDSVFYNFNIKSLSGTVYQDSTAYSNEGTYVGYVTPPPYRTVLTQLKRGDKFKIILPSYLAFGKNGNGNIPSNEVIISEISTYGEASQAALDDARIKAYLAANSLTAAAERDTETGIYYIITTPGTGTDIINLGSTITAKYTGRLLNGTVFDSSTDGTFVNVLSGLVPGWKKLLPKLKDITPDHTTTGTHIRMFIPSGLGYGTAAQAAQTSGQATIPANSVLDFDVEITAITN